jgi:hypothetical protein
VRPFCLNHQPIEGYVVDPSVVIFLLSFSAEVCARSPGNHVNDSMERLFDKVLLFSVGGGGGGFW